MRNSSNPGVTTTTAAPYPSGDWTTAPCLDTIMQFQVGGKVTTKSTYSIPAAFSTAGFGFGPVALTRDVPLDEIEDSDTDEMRDPDFGSDPNNGAYSYAPDPNNPGYLIGTPTNGSNDDPVSCKADASGKPILSTCDDVGGPAFGMIELKHWAAPVSITPKLGSTEIWRFINATPDAHPIHVHLVEFQILDRQQFDVDHFKATRQVSFINPTTGRTFPVQQPSPEEVNAPKDVVRVDYATVTRVQMKFNLPEGTVTTSGRQFNYVVHCHILEHEDNEMMRPFSVIA